MSFSHKLIVLRQSRSERLKRVFVRPSVGHSLREPFFPGKNLPPTLPDVERFPVAGKDGGGPIERFNLMGRRGLMAAVS